MLHYLVDNILSEITALNFADRVGGIVYPLQKNIIDKDGNTVLKSIPIYKNTASTCTNEDYIDLVPDDRYKSCIYFEATPETVVEESTRMGQVTTESTLTLVAWFNMKKIAQTSRSSSSMLRNIIYAVAGTRNTGDVHSVITLDSIRFRDPQVFSQYTYDEAEKQYLIYPYDFGAALFDVQMTYPICDDEPTLDPDCLNT